MVVGKSAERVDPRTQIEPSRAISTPPAPSHPAPPARVDQTILPE
jgi:hypothetical protein